MECATRGITQPARNPLHLPSIDLIPAAEGYNNTVASGKIAISLQ